MVLDMVRMAVNEQFPTFMPPLYPGSMATDPKPYGAKTISLFLRRERGRPPGREPGPPVMGVARAERRSSRRNGRRDRAIIRLLCQSIILRTPGLIKISKCRPVEE